jgi:DNA-binding NarL/FixJ family response regulator
MNQKIRCMIAEDFESLNNIYYNLLAYEKDIEVVGRAYSGKDLLEQVKTQPVDIILLDIEMGNRNEGIFICKQILSEYPHIKIIMLTCHEEEEMILAAFEAGAVDYLLKTSSLAQIIEAVRSAYNNNSFIGSHVAYVLRKRMKELGHYKENLFQMMNIISTLTVSELDVLKLLLQSKKQREIAAIRDVELVTVKSHVGGILRKFNAKRISEVIKKIKDIGLESFVTR